MNDEFISENGVLTAYTGESHNIVIPENIHTIGKNVFKGMAWITDITLPSGIKKIDENAFKGCRQLKNINFPEGISEIGDYAFHRCHSITSVNLPDSVLSVGKCAFLYCDSLESFRAAGVSRLERQTFANNTNLREILLNSQTDCSNFSDDIFTGCVKIRKIILSDGYEYDIENLISEISSENKNHPVVKAIAESVYQSMKIEDGTLFRFCVNLKSFDLPEGITCIEKSCFYDKKGIVSVTLPESLQRIKANAFGNCINLAQITLMNENTAVDENAFRGCCNLKTIILKGNTYQLGSIEYDDSLPLIIRRINEQILSDFYISGNILMSYTGTEERVTVPDGIKIIAESCFEGNERIGRVIMSDSVREIHENAFRNCTGIQTVEMSENIISIKRNAFENCRKLIRFNVPSELKETGYAAFRGCRILETEGFETGTPPKTPPLTRTYGSNDTEPYSFSGDNSIKAINTDNAGIIGKYAYSSCSELVSVEINDPDCIIEERAFEKCPSLRFIKINAAKIEKGSFSFCRNLEHAEISGVTELGEEAFAGCTSLKEITVSESVKKIGRRCFDECTSLKDFDFSNINYIGERAFERCDNINEVSLGNITVGFHAFADCSGLGKISLCSETVLMSGAFFSCTNANTIIFNNKEYRFSEFCQSRNSADNEFPLRIQEVIGSIYSCFRINRQNGIEKYLGDSVCVKIPDDITAAEDEAFRDKLRVTEIIFPEEFRYSGKLTFSGTGWIEQKRERGHFTTVNGMIIDAAACGEKAVINEDIFRICSWAFAGNTELKELEIRCDRVIIDTFAFRNCINLKKITASDGNVYTLENISDLTEKEYPQTVKQIFTECINCFKTSEDKILTESTGNIKNLIFPDGIKGIADEVYKDCNLLESIKISPDTETIGKCAFENSRWLKNASGFSGVRKIEAMAFSGCQSLESIDVSDELEYIGKRCFEHCCSLKEIHISDRITVIPEKAFFRCKSLRKIVIPPSVKRIEAEAFAFCDMLEEVIIPPETEYVAENAFAWCDKL